MPYAQAEGARIYYEETGAGTPVLFIHEFAGDHRSWEDQVRYFGRGWRCLAWGARGYPPSDCPDDESQYGQEFFNRDAIAVLDAAKVDRAHIVGLSMGGYTALMLAAKFPNRVISCTAAGAGSGALKSARAQFIEDARVSAAEFDRAGKINAETMGVGPTRVHLQNKDPVGWRTFVRASRRAPRACRRQDAAHRAGRACVALRHGGRAQSRQGARAAAGRR